MTERGSGLVTILFTDLVGSTELLARAGDEEAQRIFQAHHELLAGAAAAQGGEEVKWLGDGLMVAFASATGAVRAALAMQAASRRPVHGERLAIRVGLNACETLRDAHDYFGTAVVVARRLCDQAQAGQTLCSDPCKFRCFSSWTTSTGLNGAPWPCSATRPDPSPTSGSCSSAPTGTPRSTGSIR